MEGNDHRYNIKYMESHQGKQEEPLCVVSSNLQAGHLWGLACEIYTVISFRSWCKPPLYLLLSLPPFFPFRRLMPVVYCTPVLVYLYISSASVLVCLYISRPCVLYASASRITLFASTPLVDFPFHLPSFSSSFSPTPSPPQFPSIKTLSFSQKRAIAHRAGKRRVSPSFSST